MRINARVASVSGKTSQSRWGQVLTLPHAYAVVEITDADTIARTRGVTILTKISRELDTHPHDLESIEKLAQRFHEPGVETILLLVPVGSVLYIVLLGDGCVLLKRKEHISKLLVGSGSISGEVKTGDIVLCASRGFVESFDQTALASVFDHLNAQEAAEKLTLMLHKEQEMGYGSAFLYEVVSISESEPAFDKPIERSRVSFHLPVITRQRFYHAMRTLRRGRIPGAWRIRRLITRYPRKFRAAVFLSCMLLFGVLLFGGVMRQQSASTQTVSDQSLIDIRHIFEEGVALRDLNPIKSREKLGEATAAIEKLAKTVSPKTPRGREIGELQKQIADNLVVAMRVYRVKPELFFDLALLTKGAQVGGMALSGDTLSMVDTTGKSLYTLSVSSKNGHIVWGGESLKLKPYIGISDSTFYLLGETGIYEVTRGKKAGKPIITKDPEWGEVSGLVSYAGNIYVLDTGKHRIWKYVTVDNKPDKREYLNPDVFPDFSRATNMNIDGSIWIGTTDGKVMKFTGGKEDTFVPKGVDPALGNVLRVFVTDESTHVYLLDSSQGRIVVLDKEGIYVAQYVFEGGIAPTGFVVLEDAKKALLLDSGFIYSIDLK